MKKIIILLSVLFITGCSFNDKGVERIESDTYGILSYTVPNTNVGAKGFKYYKPRDFAMLEEKEFNHTLVHNGNKYYLNIDINAYYSKFKPNYIENDSLYYSKKLNCNDLSGYIEIRKGKNSYFYIKMLYNYSYIEVEVKESDINDAVNSSLVILSSIRYNDKVISELTLNKDVAGKETQYEIKKPDLIEESKNILDVYEYDAYTE